MVQALDEYLETAAELLAEEEAELAELADEAD